MTAFIISLIINMILILKFCQLQKELKHLYNQLNLIEIGSHIELTSAGYKGQKFLRIYQKLNHIFIKYEKQEVECLHSQNLLKQTISNLSHDIRTPLTSAMGYLQMLEESKDTSKQERYLEIINKRLSELKNMLEELFLYSKLSNSNFTLECSSISVFPILSECMTEMYYEFEKQKIEPQIRFEQENIKVLANQEALKRIFRNLIKNALIHGTGRLWIYQKEESIFFCNSISPNKVIDTNQLFERFYKAESARTKGSSGLGLAIVKELTEYMGGSVSAEQKNNNLQIEIHFKADSFFF